jgi:hypothetical protein
MQKTRAVLGLILRFFSADPIFGSHSRFVI